MNTKRKARSGAVDWVLIFLELWRASETEAWCARAWSKKRTYKPEIVWENYWVVVSGARGILQARGFNLDVCVRARSNDNESLLERVSGDTTKLTYNLAISGTVLRARWERGPK